MTFDLTVTFDNGPEVDVTPGVLDVLAAHGVRATFFVIGAKLQLPGAWELACRAVAEGHWLANHTYTHTAPLGTLHDAALAAELEITGTQRLLDDLGRPERFFRPLGGDGGGVIDRRLLSAAAADLLQRDRYTLVLWNALPRDWVNPDSWPEIALQQAERRRHAVLVIHDIATGAMAHLDRFLRMATDAGAHFRQEFPTDVTPIVEGRVIGQLAQYVTDPVQDSPGRR